MIKCFDVAKVVIENAAEEISGEWTFSDGRMTKIEEICNGIDSFLADNCDESYGMDVDVDVDTKELIIGAEFNFCEFKENDPMYKILREANDIIISESKENPPAIRVEMRFNGAWIS